jgi:hypothetical protein
MQESPSMQDPASGYASADALDPEAEVNRDHSGDGDAEAMQDAMTGYASADVLDPDAAINRHEPAEGGEALQDPMSGYTTGATAPNP